MLGRLNHVGRSRGPKDAEKAAKIYGGRIRRRYFGGGCRCRSNGGSSTVLRDG